VQSLFVPHETIACLIDLPFLRLHLFICLNQCSCLLAHSVPPTTSLAHTHSTVLTGLATAAIAFVTDFAELTDVRFAASGVYDVIDDR
jgi:hypothetical protein